MILRFICLILLLLNISCAAEKEIVGASNTALASNTPINYPPFVNDLNMDFYSGEVVSFQIKGYDPEGADLSFSPVTLPQGLSMSSSGLITGTLPVRGANSAAQGYNGTITVSDGSLTYTARFSWVLH